MALFLSTSRHKIDRKGRVSIPAAFREALAGERFEGVCLAPPLGEDACVEGFGISRVEQMAAALEDLNPLDPERDALAVAMLSSVVQAGFDGDGRIVLPQPLIEYAGLCGEALFAGLGEKFQIWAPEVFEARQSEARAVARGAAGRLPWRRQRDDAEEPAAPPRRR